MTPQDLIAAFDTLAEAPEGVTRLRELVLQLAVRGKLVPQDPEDEPAGALLAGFGAARQQLIAAGQINKPRHPEGVPLQEAPFEVPDSWCWVRLGDVGAIVGGGTPKSGESSYWSDSSEIPWLTPADMRSQPSRWVSRGKRDITQAGLSNSSAQLMPRGSVLFSSRAPIGHVGIASNPLATNQGFKSCVPYCTDMSEYVYFFLLHAGREIDETATGTTFKEVSGKDVALVPIPVPPLAEQKRIVARVDELMGLLDRLEAARNAREATRTALRDAALAALRDADTPEEVEAAWERIAGRMDDLFTDPADVEPLRQAVLQLAVRGRLVPQSPEDEPASVLLERIAVEKARLVEEGKIRRPKELPPVSAHEVPFEVPVGWVWTRLEPVAVVVTDGDHQPPPRADDGIAFLTIGNVSSGHLDFTNTRFVPEAYYRGLDPLRCPTDGDLLYTVVGTYGRAVAVDSCPPFCVQRHIAIIRPLMINRDYLVAYLKSPWAYQQATDAKTGSAQPTVALAPLRRFSVAVPPLAEQRRIVGKMDELMDLLDRLEKHLADKTTAHDAFAAATAHSLER